MFASNAMQDSGIRPRNPEIDFPCVPPNVGQVEWTKSQTPRQERMVDKDIRWQS